MVVLVSENVAAGASGAADVVNAISGEFVGGGIVVWAEGGKSGSAVRMNVWGGCSFK